MEKSKPTIVVSVWVSNGEVEVEGGRGVRKLVALEVCWIGDGPACAFGLSALAFGLHRMDLGNVEACSNT